MTRLFTTVLHQGAHYLSAANANAVVGAGGVDNYNASQLSKFGDRKQLSVGPYIYERFVGISRSATTEDLATTMQMIYANIA